MLDNKFILKSKKNYIFLLLNLLVFIVVLILFISSYFKNHDLSFISTVKRSYWSLFVIYFLAIIVIILGLKIEGNFDLSCKDIFIRYFLSLLIFAFLSYVFMIFIGIYGSNSWEITEISDYNVNKDELEIFISDMKVIIDSESDIKHKSDNLLKIQKRLLDGNYLDYENTVSEEGLNLFIYTYKDECISSYFDLVDEFVNLEGKNTAGICTVKFYRRATDETLFLVYSGDKW